MLTLKVHGKLVTWSRDFTEFMIGHYKKFDVSFEVCTDGEG